MSIPPTNHEFLAWVKKHDWLLIAENKTPEGRQDLYCTPAGEIVAAIYDLKGNFFGVGKPPIPVIMPQPAQRISLDPYSLRQ
ncbi:unnamed protein product, partial [marine sediment metagenome]